MAYRISQLSAARASEILTYGPARVKARRGCFFHSRGAMEGAQSIRRFVGRRHNADTNKTGIGD